MMVPPGDEETRGGHFGHGQRGGVNRRDSSQGYGRSGGNQHHNQQHNNVQINPEIKARHKPPSPARQPISSPSAPRQPPAGSAQSQSSRQPSSPVMTKPHSEPTPRPVSPGKIKLSNSSKPSLRIGLTATDAGACLKQILGEDNADTIKDAYAFAPHTLFLDSLGIIMDSDSELYRPALRDFLMATGVSPALMRQVLDAPILQQIGLIRENFTRLGVRQATNLLYRQANYNLLREETEGYSKLITELFATNSVNIHPSRTSRANL
ncbi:THO2 plays a role in transcriptional elongation [Metarhizium acridum]|nr:THO2 plays a role in transcriptional elongation [Metarhizium acridum]